MTPNLERQVPFDPDFDESPDELEIIETIETGSEYSVISPKQAFAAGLISSILALGTIGFIVVLVRLIVG